MSTSPYDSTVGHADTPKSDREFTAANLAGSDGRSWWFGRTGDREAIVRVYSLIPMVLTAGAGGGKVIQLLRLDVGCRSRFASPNNFYRYHHAFRY